MFRGEVPPPPPPPPPPPSRLNPDRSCSGILFSLCFEVFLLERGLNLRVQCGEGMGGEETMFSVVLVAGVGVFC